MHRLLHTGGILSINLTHEVCHLYDTVREFRLGRLANSRAERYNLLITCHQFSETFYVVVLLISAMLGISYLVPVIFIAFFPKEKPTEFTKLHEANPFMLVPIMVTGVLSVVMGINPNFGPHLYDLATLAAEAVMKGAVH